MKSFLRLFLVLALAVPAVWAQDPANYKGKPYQGKAQSVPGRVEAELFDDGGPGLAFSVDTPSKVSTKFRKDAGVAIQTTKAADKNKDGSAVKPGANYLAWGPTKGWLMYTIDVQQPGTYRIDAQLASRYNDAEVSIAVHDLVNSDKSSTGTVILPGTADVHTWRTFENLGTVRLNKGPHLIILTVLKRGEFSLDYLNFVPVVEVAAKPFEPIDPFVQVKQMQRGVNIIGYDPIWKEFERGRFKQDHFKKIKEGGFNTLRVNLQAFQHMDGMNRLSPAWLKTMDWVVDNAIANDLVVILDEHDYEPCGKDAAFCRTKLLAFWEQVATRYKDAPNNVIFEILNEPNSAITIDGWNSLMSDALTIIRRTNPQRNVIIGPAMWNSFNQLSTMKLPADDRHIIVTVHYYGPHRFTHQGAYWSKETAKLSGITWGTEAEQQAVANDFAPVQTWSKANNRPILLGEFGAYDKAPMESRVKWTAHVARTAESMDWAWTYWQFDADFIVWDMDKNTWVEPIRKALIPDPAAAK